MPLASDNLGYDELVAGLASALGSSLIILTYLFFPNLRKLRYVELVYYVAINDLMASIGMSLGPSPNDSLSCWYQGLSTTGNYLSSVFWTSLITYQVYHVVVQEGTVLKEMFWYHVVCWGLPLLLTVLPLTTSTYNNPDDEATWCFVSDRTGSPPWSQLFWFIASFYAWIWLSMLWSLFMLISIALKLRKLQVVPEVIASTVGKLAPYPFIISVCWSLNTLANIYTFSTGRTYNDLSSDWSLISTLGVILATAQGFFNALVFFYMNPLVRQHWVCLAQDLYENVYCCGLCCYCCCCCLTSNTASTEERLTGDGHKNHICSDWAAYGKTDTVNGTSSRPNNTGRGGASNAGNSGNGANIDDTMGINTARASSLFNNTRNMKLSIATANQLDYVGIDISNMRSNSTNNHTSGANNNGDEEEDMNRGSVVGGGESSSRFSNVMEGMKRTTSGWWEMTSRGSSIGGGNLGPSSFSHSFSFSARPSTSANNSTSGNTSGNNNSASGSNNATANNTAANAGTNNTYRGDSVASRGSSMIELQHPSQSNSIINPIYRGSTTSTSTQSRSAQHSTATTASASSWTSFAKPPLGPSKSNK